MRVWPLCLPALPLAFTLAPATAHADEGVDIGLRTGVSVPLGEAESNQAMSDLVTAVVPIWLDVSYRFTDRLAIGVYGQYGIAILPSVAGESKSAYQLRIGALLTYRLPIEGRHYVPWIGAGIGWEDFAVHNTQTGPSGEAIDTHITSQGVEFLSFHGGVDWSLGGAFRLGPFASLALGEYLSHGGSSNTPEVTIQTGGIDGKALHVWASLGVRGVYSL